MESGKVTLMKQLYMSMSKGIKAEEGVARDVFFFS